LKVEEDGWFIYSSVDQGMNNQEVQYVLIIHSLTSLRPELRIRASRAVFHAVVAVSRDDGFFFETRKHVHYVQMSGLLASDPPAARVRIASTLTSKSNAILRRSKFLPR